MSWQLCGFCCEYLVDADWQPNDSWNQRGQGCGDQAAKVGELCGTAQAAWIAIRASSWYADGRAGTVCQAEREGPQSSALLAAVDPVHTASLKQH